MNQGPTAIDCFAGAGGLSLGLTHAGFNLMAAFDASRVACATYERNIGSHILQADVQELSGADLLSDAGVSREEVTLVAGGPPCQGFSVQRRGSDVDPRNLLIFEFLRIVTEIFPPFFLMENVSSIRGVRGNNALHALKQAAERDGYRIHQCVLDAAEYGIPQHRRRLFLVGQRRDVTARFAFPQPTHGPMTYRTLRDAIADLPPPGNVGHVSIPNHEKDNISDINRLRISFVPPGGGRQHIPPGLRLPCHSVSVETAGHRNVYGRLDWDQPAGTITTKCNSFTRGKFAHPEEHRNITMREAARLQGFPDDFVFLGNKVDVAHQIGNAVPPALAHQLGSAVLAALASPPKTDMLLARKQHAQAADGPHALSELLRRGNDAQ